MVKPVQGEGQNWLLKTGDSLIQVHLLCILLKAPEIVAA